FKVTAPTETLNCFVNIARPFDVTIRGVNANTAGNYQFKYAIESGAGYITYRGAVVEQDALVMLSGSANELQFVGTEVGAANLVITIVNGSGEEKGFSLKCNVQETAFVFDVIPSAGSLSPDSMIDLAMSINEVNPSTYKTKYEVLPADQGTVAGSGSVIVNGTELANNTFVDTQSGQFTWKFMADELGPVKLKFTTENGFGVIAEKEISLQVSETPEYTFTAVSSGDTQANIDAVLGIDFNLNESSGTSTYTMTFTNTNTGSLAINGTPYEAGDQITITPGEFTGNYTGTEAGDHTLTFTVQNAFDPPLERTATVTFTYIDPNSNKPIITLGGDGENVQLCQGVAFVETVTAVDAQGNTIPTNEIVITGSVDETTPGSYGLTYNVSDSQGNAADEISRTVTVTALPTAIIGADLTSGQAPLEVTFNPTGSTAAAPATLVSVQYIFGDGTQSAVLDFPSNITHTYTTAERFTAQLIVTDSNGCINTQDIEIDAAQG
ncbi:immunoglobulin-like domain-containing protein, partial [Spongiivirga citrea]